MYRYAAMLKCPKAKKKIPGNGIGELAKILCTEYIFKFLVYYVDRYSILYFDDVYFVTHWLFLVTGRVYLKIPNNLSKSHRYK